MAALTQHPCAAPGCAELLPAGGPSYCRAHARRRDHYRGSQRARGYTWRWEQRRALFLQLYPLCGMRPGGRPPVSSSCWEARRVTPATVVDHVIPHKGDAALMWNEVENWQALCARCHGLKTNAERG
jgi:5-methylcytosine-specific restriction protein A